MSDLLKGARILVTRPSHQAEALCQLIEQHGGLPIRYPTLDIVGLDTVNPATFWLEHLSKYQWLIFTSANAVNFACVGNSGKIHAFTDVNIAAIGNATAVALEDAGLVVNLVPESGFTSEALLAMSPMHHVEGCSILIVRGQGGRDVLANELTRRGANVDYLDVYKRVIPDNDNTEVYDCLKKNMLTVVVATSSEALQNLLTMLGERYQNILKNLDLVVISDRIGNLAKEMGFKKIAVSTTPSDSAIVNALTVVISGDKCG